MSNLKVVDEKAMSLIKLKEDLELIEKRDEELNFRANRTKEYLNMFVKMDSKEFESLMKKIEELNIPRLKEKHIIKILNVMPENMDSLKAVLSGETITIKDEDIKKIVDVL